MKDLTHQLFQQLKALEYAPEGGIESERINVTPAPDVPEWYAFYHNDCAWFAGPTALTAAMRCFVASRLGDEVDIPEELLQ